MFNDGKEVIDCLEGLLSEVEIDDIDLTRPIQPLNLLLLDINMPLKNGFETLEEVKKLFSKHNTRL